MDIRTERRLGRAVIVLAGFLASGASPALDLSAQQRHGGHVHDAEEDEEHDHGTGYFRVPRWQLGGGLAVAVPQGDFSRFVGEGFGLGLHAVYGLDRSNVIGVRFDAGFVNYGSERFAVPLLPTTGRVLVDVDTRNNIGMLGIGPQIQVPTGPIRPYVNGFVGLGYFFTESSVGGSSNFPGDDFARTVNFDDVSLAYGAGAGLGIRLGTGRRPIYLNFEGQYRRHGDTEYLREGSILDDGFGGVVITPLFSDADFVLLQLGISIGL